MPLSPARVALRFSGGIETEMDSKQVPSTRLLALENGVFVKALSVAKRNGYAARSRSIAGSPVGLTGLRRMAKRGDELLVFDRSRAFSHQAASDEWIDAGAVFSVLGSDRPAVRTGTEQTMPDCASSSGVIAYAWEDSRGGVWWAAVSTATGRFLRGPEQIDALGQRPRCVTVEAARSTCTGRARWSARCTCSSSIPRRRRRPSSLDF
jgi:hypothetical protein